MSIYPVSVELSAPDPEKYRISGRLCFLLTFSRPSSRTVPMLINDGPAPLSSRLLACIPLGFTAVRTDHSVPRLSASVANTE